MKKICIFAGTSEGRRLAEFMSGQDVQVTACVATEYGEEMIPAADNLTVLAGRLPVDDIIALLKKESFDLVIDATHPYAASITDSIIKACDECSVDRVRVLRGASFDKDTAAKDSQVVWAPNTQAAVEFLKGCEGNILLTTGSKELINYASIPDFGERVYARVLPMGNSLELCQEAGLKPAHIIAMQGPFTQEINTAMLKFTRAGWMVTKDGGDAGGFEAKVRAAQEAAARLLVIGRPVQREGITIGETIELLCSKYGLVRKPKVTIVGIGPGCKDSMTLEVRKAIDNAECIIGAARMVEASCEGKASFDAIAPLKIAEVINTHPEYNDFVVVMSGDSGFFSGTKKLVPLLENCQVEVLPGLSSMSILCARLKTSYEDVKAVSLHGRDRDIVQDVVKYPRVFTLVGGDDGINRLCQSLIDAGLGNVRLSVGERLSYPDEKITTGTASELAAGSYHSLSAALIENESADGSDVSVAGLQQNNVNRVTTHGLPDEAFQRGEGPEGVVPMTKREVRSVAISMMELKDNSVCWDVGAGTGSVAIEMALKSPKGHVYAIERKEAAADLIEVNKTRLGAYNVTVIRGLAPEACQDLPAPSHVFVGGSSGNMKDIIKLAMEKNPEVKIVATAIALESVAELTNVVKDMGFRDAEIVSMTAARSRKAGPYHLMTGQNPVYIFSL